MTKKKSFRLAGFYCDPKTASYENWSILALFLAAQLLLMF